MKAGYLFVILLGVLSVHNSFAQQPCLSYEYIQQQKAKGFFFPGEQQLVAEDEQQTSGTSQDNVIKIPVVVHVLYNTQAQKIDDNKIHKQIALLNECFRKQNKDTANIPEAFKGLAADIEIEFYLAVSDPRRVNTTGIVKKYTPVTKWTMDDKMKFSAEYGNDAWDTKSYLNIWVCKLDRFAGYSSFPGGNVKTDGIVIDLGAFNGSNKTLVHEAGHWLNLRHIWGDEYCGDDGVDDTPRQADYTPGCPNTVRITCSNGPYGDMYMNYMDFTGDACLNMFTLGQKERMRALFGTGGSRKAILQSTGLQPPLIYETPLPGDEEEEPQWQAPKLFPNPVSRQLTLDISYDERWIGKTAFITDIRGRHVMNTTISSRVLQINVGHLAPGVYFFAAKREDGLSIMQKFIKL